MTFLFLGVIFGNLFDDLFGDLFGDIFGDLFGDIFGDQDLVEEECKKFEALMEQRANALVIRSGKVSFSKQKFMVVSILYLQEMSCIEGRRASQR